MAQLFLLNYLNNFVPILTSISLTPLFIIPLVTALGRALLLNTKSGTEARDNPTNWTENLPLVLLGLRSSVKEDVDVSSIHMVYGTSLHMHGQFFDQTAIEQLPTSEHIEQLVS